MCIGQWKCPGSVATSAQSVVGKIIESNPSSQKTWKPHWFYASGVWEFAEGVDPRRPMIQRRFRMPSWAVMRDASIKHWSWTEPISHLLSKNKWTWYSRTERAADKLLIRECMISPSGELTAPLCNKCNQHEFGRAELFRVYTAMRPSRNDHTMQAKLMRMAKGSYGGSTGGSQPIRVCASPYMSVARSQATGVTTSPA
ncbi:unnamed protein product [Prunus armeniaca]